MRKLFSVSGNQYFWLIMTGGKELKQYLGWIELITFSVFVAGEKKLRKLSFGVAENGTRVDTTVGMPTKLHSRKEVG